MKTENENTAVIEPIRKRKRKKCSVPARILAYGAFAPREKNENAIVLDQMYQAWRFKQRLIDAELIRRRESEAAIESGYPEVRELRLAKEAAQREVDEAYEAVKTANAGRRAHYVSAEDSEAISKLKKTAKTASDAWLARRKAAYKLAETHLAPINDKANAARRFEYAVSGNPGDTPEGMYPLYPGSKLVAMEAMRKSRSGPPPVRKPWEGVGSIGVQLPKGCPVVRAMAGEDTMFRIEAGDKPKHKVLWLRIASNAKRDPVWVRFPFVMHRELPAAATVKWVTVFRYRIGDRYKWEVQFTVTAASFGSPVGDGQADVEIAFGTTDGGGIRIARWHDRDDNAGEIVIEADEVSRWAKADELKSTGDSEHDTIMRTLMSLRDGHAVPAETLAHHEWLTARAETDPKSQARLIAEAEAWGNLIRGWQAPLSGEVGERLRRVGTLRSRAAMYRLARWWFDHRAEGDELVFGVLLAWAKRDRHLYQWECDQRHRAILWRRHFYRNAVAKLAGQYGNIRLDDSRWRRLSESLKKEDDLEPERMHGFRAKAKIAAVSEFIRFLKERASVMTAKGGAGDARDAA